MTNTASAPKKKKRLSMHQKQSLAGLAFLMPATLLISIMTARRKPFGASISPAGSRAAARQKPPRKADSRKRRRRRRKKRWTS